MDVAAILLKLGHWPVVDILVQSLFSSLPFRLKVGTLQTALIVTVWKVKEVYPLCLQIHFLNPMEMYHLVSNANPS